VQRRLPDSVNYVRRGDWPVHGAFPIGRTMTNKLVGIVGMGRIGLAIAKRALAFDMRIAYTGPRQKPDVPYPYEPDLVKLAREVDFLVIACPGGPETKHLIGRDVLVALGAEGTLVNVSRGSVVDEAALVAAIMSGELGAAALDVFEREPHVPTELLSRSNVIVLPHVGSATAETRAAMGQLVVDNLLAHFEKRPLLTPVPPPVSS
jgi:lactate dehydrogenase-like 2-hydroxyacid dehydrogenase